MSTQLQFPLQLPVSRPLVPIEAAMVMLDRTEDEVLELLDTGELTWAWDIRSPDADRREIRIWRESLMGYFDRGSRGLKPAEPPSEPQVLAAVIPTRPELRSTEIRRIFTCSSTHVLKLVRAGCLDGLNPPHVGPNGFVRVRRASVIRFLQQRVVK